MHVTIYFVIFFFPSCFCLLASSHPAFQSTLPQIRSSSDLFRLHSDPGVHVETEQNQSQSNTNTISISDSYLLLYSDILYFNNLFDQRNELLKYVENKLIATTYVHVDIENLFHFEHHCQYCNSTIACSPTMKRRNSRSKISPNLTCKKCRAYTLKCSICEIAVKGVTCICSKCGHGA
jgi:hypothetical protein